MLTLVSPMLSTMPGTQEALETFLLNERRHVSGVLYFPVGDRTTVSELEESAKSFGARAVLMTQTSDHLREREDFTGNIVKRQSKSRPEMASFHPVCCLLPIQAKTAHFLGGWVSLQMNSPL